MECTIHVQMTSRKSRILRHAYYYYKLTKTLKLLQRENVYYLFHYLFLWKLNVYFFNFNKEEFFT